MEDSWSRDLLREELETFVLRAPGGNWRWGNRISDQISGLRRPHISLAMDLSGRSLLWQSPCSGRPGEALEGTGPEAFSNIYKWRNGRN